MYNLKHNMGVIASPMAFHDRSGLTADNVAALIRERTSQLGVPARISTDTVKEGGLFGATYPCVVIEHPNPPQRYFTDVYVINGGVVNFYYFGESKANTATNKAKSREGSLTGMFMNAISGSQEMAYQQEQYWHKQILDIFESLIN